MSIKVTLGEAKTHNEKSFPKLMQENSNSGFDSGIIVLFQEKECGTVIKTNPTYLKRIGYHSTDFRMSDFTDYNEPITLQNE